ncbi:MAG: UvrD-helicase domain-containing protein [Pedobacter sp.]|uniref:UvrD-helicase domain-containing protein n=1 Tax=Pedobacter sp. TaxID=1411316 RepID=UPI003569AE37
MTIYATILQSDFESILTGLGKWLLVKNTDYTKENVYLVDDNIKIFSSIVNGSSRPVGDDAIRVMIWDSVANMPLRSSESRVYLIDTWSKNLINHINKVRAELLTIKKCPRCGAFLVERENSKTHEKFWGCMNFKNCKNNTSKAINTTKDNVEVSQPIELGESPIIPPPKSEESLGSSPPLILIPNEDQEHIFEEIKTGKSHVGIVAGAGCAKSTTIVWATKFIPPHFSVLFLAFNRDIVEHLKTKLPKNVDVKTYNSLGHSNILRHYGYNAVKFDEYKQRNIIQDIVYSNSEIPDNVKQEAITLINRVVSLCKTNLIEVDKMTIEPLIEHYNIELIDPIDIDMLTFSTKLAIDTSLTNKKLVDYNDQIYFPAVLDISCKKYDIVICDESQDTSPANMELILKSVNPNGRIIFVGDPNQAIYSWRGADSEAMQNIIDELDATVLPLNTSYRLPLSHVNLANKIVPELKARPNAPEGIIKSIGYSDFYTMIKPNDMILCRNNAPLIKPALELLSRGMNVAIKGKDIGENLITIIKKFKSRTMKEFYMELDNWKSIEVKKCERNNTPIDIVTDKYNVINIISDGCENIDCIINKIKTIFSDKFTAITFSSVHRAKGLEADTVFILEPQLMPSRHANQQHQIDEEKHIFYVAITRSKNALYFVSEKPYDFNNVGFETCQE